MALAYAESESAATELAIKALAEHHWTNAKLDGDVVPVAVDQVEDITLREAAKSAKLYGCALIAY